VSKAKNKNKKLRLLEKDPHCYHCGTEVFDGLRKENGRPHRQMATIDHLISKLKLQIMQYEGDYSLTETERRRLFVLSCYNCNDIRAKLESKKLGRNQKIERQRNQ